MTSRIGWCDISWNAWKFETDYSRIIPIDITAQKMKFSIKDLFSKCDQIRSVSSELPHFSQISIYC